MSNAAENASNKTETLSSEFLILKDDFEEAMNALKQRKRRSEFIRSKLKKWEAKTSQNRQWMVINW